MSQPPTILWFRRDMRLSDNAALCAAAARGGAVLPVYILDEVAQAQGAAPLWRTGLAVERLQETLEARGSRLILRHGAAAKTICALVRESGAGAVYWNRLYDPEARDRDETVAAALDRLGVEHRSFAGHLLFEPERVRTKSGGAYQVYTPFWNRVKSREVWSGAPAPSRIETPASWPPGDRAGDWQLATPMNRGAGVVAPWLRIGESAAHDRLERFVAERIGRYRQSRDMVAEDGTSELSENLTYGEISVQACWHAGMRALQEGSAGAETFLKELVWRDFAHHLAFHDPRLIRENWRPEWDGFPWSEDEGRPEVLAWKQGRTGMRFVDAAMRDLFVTGRMHNRARMIAASYLTKHLLGHWRIGQRWFADCLVDWDPASNALGWQWVAGSGPDAAPYFRVFNPESQLAKFDPRGRYAARWIAEGQDAPAATALSYFDAVPRRWGLAADDPYPAPVVTAEAGRERALARYQEFR